MSGEGSAAFAALRALPLFARVDDATLTAVAPALELQTLATETVLLRQGEPGDAMYLIVGGSVRVEVRADDGTSRVVCTLQAGAQLGEIQLVTGGLRTATVIANEPTQVYRLGREALVRLGAAREPIEAVLTEVAQRRLETDELSAALRKVIGQAEHEVIAAFQRCLTWVALKRGDILFRQGDEGDAWFIITSGRLEIEITNPHGEPVVVGQMVRGESLGEIALLTGEKRTATVYAVRDTRVARIDKRDFDAIMLSHPQVLMSVSRTLSRTLVKRTGGGGKPRKRQRLSVVVIGNDGASPTAWVAEALVAELAQLGPVLHVTPASVAAAGVVDGVATLPDAHPGWQRFANWLEQQEGLHEYIVLEGGAAASPWLYRTLRNADHVLVVADATAPCEPSALEQGLFGRNREKRRGAHQSLVLVHPPQVRLPVGTAAWLAPRPYMERHFHAQAGRVADVARIARLLAGRAIGLTLGGGGARGFAHLGVMRALRELGVPVDYLGGTSMGAIMAGQLAMDVGLEELFDLNARIAATKPFTEYTLPFVAMLRSRRIDASARMAFAEINIEDLWIPYFCISANLTRAEMVVHERGPLWAATRASGSLPGIAVPVIDGHSLLVDGGVINNLPGDIMRQRCGGAVIAVDVSPEEDVSMAQAQFPSPWAMLWNRLNPRQARLAVPSLSDILMRTLMLGSASRTNAIRREVDVYLRPPIDKFGMLEFDSMRAIAEAGYVHTIAELPTWLANWRAQVHASAPTAEGKRP